MFFCRVWFIFVLELYGRICVKCVECLWKEYEYIFDFFKICVGGLFF